MERTDLIVGFRQFRPAWMSRLAVFSCLLLFSLESAIIASPLPQSDSETFRTPGAGNPKRAATLRKRQALGHVDARDTAARYRAEEHLTFGLPFVEGRLKDVSQLRIWQAEGGRALPAQARSLSRWPDGSVRWALLDSRLQLQSRDSKQIAVGLAPDIPETESPWRVQRTGDGRMLIDDGETAWTVVSRERGVDRVAGLSARLVDIQGHEYRGQVDKDSIEWLERGPLRAVVRVRGAFRAVDEGLDIDFYTFTVHAHFMAGIASGHVEWTIENTPLEHPPGALAFESFELFADAPGEIVGVQLPVPSPAGDIPFSMSQTVPEGTVVKVAGKPVTSGLPHDLWAGLLTAEDGLFVRMVASGENHPSSLSHAPGGPLVIGLLPKDADETFFLDDASRKTFRMDLVRTKKGALGRNLIVQATRPIHIARDPREIAETGAWGDAGHIFVPDKVDLSRPATRPSQPPTGWADWGESSTKNTHSSGSPRNKLSVFLEGMQSGRADLYQWNIARAWHAMDIRPYHIRGFRAADAPWANLYEGTPHGNNKPGQTLGRHGMDKRYPEYKEGIPWGGHGYNGFDPEHMTLDDVYECYLLTGSWLALDALRSAGEAMLTWKELVDGGYIHSSRTFGWTLRALIQVYRATGEEHYLAAARRYVAKADAERGKGEVKYLRRMRPDPRHLANEHYDPPFMVAVALHGLSAYYDETGDPIVPPMAADLVSFLLTGYTEQGFVPDLPTDRVPTKLRVTSNLGVTTWVPGAIAAAAYITGDHEPVDRILPYYIVLRSHTSAPLEFGNSDWHWWQPYLASLQQRHGESAVFDPQAYVESSGRR